MFWAWQKIGGAQVSVEDGFIGKMELKLFLIDSNGQQFQEQEDVYKNSNLITNNDIETPIGGIMVGKESMFTSQEEDYNICLN